MPTYLFKCKTCQRNWEERRLIDERDQPAQCPRCGSHNTKRMPVVSNFTVKGYNAKNGYSRK